MAIALLPGTFDPVTLGHLDIVERTSRLVDEIVIAVGNNFTKRPWFSVQERVLLLQQSVAEMNLSSKKIRIVTFEGLLVDCVRRQGATCVVKGVRGSLDFSHEMVQATTNRELAGVETLFLLAAPQWAHVSSSLVRELVTWGADVSHYVPPPVNVALTSSDNDFFSRTQ